MSTERDRLNALLDGIVANAEEARAVLDSVLIVPKPEPGTDVIHVKVGESVQAAYDTLLPTGGVIRLAPGTHRGDLQLAERPTNAKQITFTSDSENLPDENTRTGPEYAEALGIIEGVSTSCPVVRIPNRSRHTAFVNVGFAPPLTKSYAHIDLGGDEAAMLTPDDRPDGFLFDRCYIYGDPLLGGHRGLTLNAANVTVRKSYVKDIIEIGRDAQAISAWNGGQNLLIDDCHLEASGENVMFGGADSASPDMTCADIVIRDCTLQKVYNDAWKAASIKCLFEIKNVKRLLVDRCLMQNNWKRDWATGVAIMLKACSGGSDESWATCEDVTMSNLVLRHIGSVIGIIGKNDSGRISDWMRRVRFSNILAHTINVSPWLGTGRGCEIANGAEDYFELDHVTMHTNGHSWMNVRFDSGITKSPGPLIVTNSVLAESSYGYLSEPNGVGFAAIDKDWTGPNTVAGNVWKIGSRSQGTMPPNNLRLDAAAWDASLGPDHLVQPGSAAAAVPTTDGKLPGAIGAALPVVSRW